MNKIPPQRTFDLDISIRCLNTLHVNNIVYVKQLTDMTLTDLKALKTISSKTIEEIVNILADYGLALKDLPKLPNLFLQPLEVRSEVIDIIGFHSAYRHSDITSTSHVIDKSIFLQVLPYLLEAFSTMTIEINQEEVKITIPY